LTPADRVIAVYALQRERVATLIINVLNHDNGSILRSIVPE
jgi:hypothetical protein